MIEYINVKVVILKLKQSEIKYESLIILSKSLFVSIKKKKKEREKKSNNELSHSCKCEHKYDLFKDWIKIKSQHIKYIEK